MYWLEANLDVGDWEDTGFGTGVGNDWDSSSGESDQDDSPDFEEGSGDSVVDGRRSWRTRKIIQRFREER